MTQVRRGKKIKSERKFFPAYVLAKLTMTDDVYHLVKNTPKVTGFLGSSGKPQAISEAEAARCGDKALLASALRDARARSLALLDAYEAALVGLYGDETLDLATDLIDGEIRFLGLQSPGLNLEGCDLHQRLLKQYEKAHAAG